MGAFFIDSRNGYGKIEGDDAYHLLKVLRLKEGDTFPVIDKKGFKGKALIVSKKDFSSLDFRVLTLENHNPEFPFTVVLAQSMIKGKNMSFLLRKATELGITKIVPIISERTVVKDVNIERWTKIIKDASKQAMRISVPDISNPMDFRDFIKNSEAFKTKIILSPYSKLHIKSYLKSITFPSELLFLSGPEGGFTEKEIKYAKEYGFSDVNLGKRILRAETVPLVFLSILEYRWTDYENSL